MVKTCLVCGRKFEPVKGHPHQKFCSRVCQLKARSDKANKKHRFAEEWRAWRHDFASGKIKPDSQEVAP